MIEKDETGKKRLEQVDNRKWGEVERIGEELLRRAEADQTQSKCERRERTQQ